MPSLEEHILVVRGLSVAYGHVQAVRDVSLDVAHGEVLGLVGESGSGKSSVLKAVAGLTGPGSRMRARSLMFAGEELADADERRLRALRGAELAYVFQNAQLSLDPLFTIGSQFDECLRVHRAIPRMQARELECALLRDMGFSDPRRVLGLYPHNLSGGECQRVVLAFSLACGARLLLADEPTSALDVIAQARVLDLLERLRVERGISILMVSHNLGVVARIADRIGVMRRGELVEVGTRDQVLHAPQHPYTRALLAAIPKSDGTLPRAVSEEGRSCC